VFSGLESSAQPTGPDVALCLAQNGTGRDVRLARPFVRCGNLGKMWCCCRQREFQCT